MFLCLRTDSGVSALELLIVVAILGVTAAIGVPLSSGIIDDVKIRGDAQAVSAAVAQARLASSAQFTRARLFVNIAASTYQIQTWKKTGAPGWVNASAPALLSDSSRFGFRSVTTPPPSTATTLTQAPLCLDDVGSAISGTACVIFNSRGLLLLPTGPPATTQTIYLNGPAGGFAVVVGPTGRLEVWRTTPTGGAPWRQQ